MNSDRSLRIGAFALAAAVALASSSAALAAKPVTGTLSKPGYKVLAIATGGTSVMATLKGRKFTVRSPGAKMTLQLLNARGRYAGPVVVGTAAKGAKAIVGVKAGAALGTVTVRAGYATTGRLAASAIDSSRTATARKGVPIGGKGFGLVAGRATATSFTKGEMQAPAASPAPGGTTGPNTALAGQDTDRDGVTNNVDIDANGNGIIDSVDPNAPVASGVQSFVNYFAGLDSTANVDANPASAAAIDPAMQNLLELVFLNVPTGAVLNCNGLTWCSPGGTGQIVPAGTMMAPGAAKVPFPACCVSGSGGLMSGTSQSAGSGAEFRIWPTATSTQISSGDTFLEQVPSTSGTTVIPGAIGFVFNTVPAAKSWQTATRSAEISYPVASGGTGTAGNRFIVDGSALNMALAFWRPQRPSITGAGEPAGFMDIGHLRYSVQMVMVPGVSPGATSTGAPQCPASTVSSTDPSLSLQSEAGGQIGRLSDSSNDMPSNPANTLTMNVDVGACIAAKGGTTASGGQFAIELEATSPSGGDHVVQTLYFRIA